MMRRIVLCAAMAASIFALVPATQAAAAPAGAFQCRATVLRVGPSAEVGTSNARGNPCASDTFTAIPINLPLGAIRLQVLGATSTTKANLQPGPDGVPGTGNGVGGGAQAGALGVTLTIGGFQLQLGAIRNMNTVVCGPGDEPPSLIASDQNDTVGITIFGRRIQLNQPLTLPLGIVTVKINHEQRTQNSLMTRALEINSPILPTIIVAESIVGYTGNPCAELPG
jgi:hypothetical protein